MLTGQLRNEVDKLWETFWTGGITNPLTVIEQITYLLFLRRLDQQQLLKEKQASELDMPVTDPIYPEEATPLRWSSFKNLDPEAMIDRFTRGITLNGEQTNVFDYMKQLAPEDTAFANHMKGATFMISTPRLLDRAVQLIDKLDMDDRDTKGDLYEYLLSKIASAGQNGQFRTPRHIIQLMVDMTLPTPTDTICDPSAGTCGFLVAADEYLRREHQDEFYKKDFRAHYNSVMFNGLEFDSSMMRIGAMNLMLHGIERPNLLHVDALSEENAGITDRYSLMLANPPFKGSLDYDFVEPSLLKVAKTKKTELLFLALILRMLRPGGRAAVIVPDGVLFGSSRAHKAIREAIVEEHQLQGVVSMPSGVFKPYAGVSTAILLFTKTNSGGTDQVWFYDMQADGYSLDDKRSELGRRMPEQPEKLAKDEHLSTLTDPHGQVIEYRVQKHEENNIPDILHRWRTPAGEAERPRTAQSFYVPVQEIRDNAYDLSINRYKEIEYEAVAYDPPQELLARIRKMEAERAQLMQELEDMLDDPA